jgi:hypothetical protein
MATTSFIQPMLLKNIFSRTHLREAVERALATDFIYHTSVYIVHSKGIAIKVANAPLRHRPNGEDMYCHNEPMKACKDISARTKLFKCISKQHTERDRYRTVELLGIGDAEHSAGRHAIPTAHYATRLYAERVAESQTDGQSQCVSWM